MSTPTFFHSNLLLNDTQVDLTPSEVAHARNSRRLKQGRPIILLNGQGLIAHCIIQRIDRDSLTASIQEIKKVAKPKRKLTLACAVPKGDRQRTMVDMLTQLGVSEVIALNCDHSVTQVNDNTLKKWQRVAVEACKQSQNPWLPLIAENLSPLELLQRLRDRSEVIKLYADGDGQRIVKFIDSVDAYNEVVIFVGPEGGFSQEETNLFSQEHLSGLCLAKNILRTEAAAIIAAAQYRGISQSE